MNEIKSTQEDDTEIVNEIKGVIEKVTDMRKEYSEAVNQVAEKVTKCRGDIEVNKKMITELREGEVNTRVGEGYMVRKEIEGIKVNMTRCREEVDTCRKEMMDLKNGNVIVGNFEGEQVKKEIRKELDGFREEIAGIGKEDDGQERRRDEKKMEEIESKIEDIERERRKKNVVIFNLNESDKAEAMERYKEDEENCNKIFQMDLAIGRIKVENLIRLGKRVENRTRPLLVKLENEEDKKEILKRTNRLRHSTSFGRVYIGRDMTQEERIKDKKLRDELREKRDGDQNAWYIIRRGKVVKADEREGGIWQGTGARPKTRGGRGNFWMARGGGRGRGN